MRRLGREWYVSDFLYRIPGAVLTNCYIDCGKWSSAACI